MQNRDSGGLFATPWLASSLSWIFQALQSPPVDISRNLPDRERLSAVMALILLAYVAARFIELPGQILAIELAGIYLPLLINVNTLVAVLVSALTAAGTDWLLRGEPGLEGKTTKRHWLLPAMTAWVLSITLANVDFGLQWFLAFTGSAFLLLTILIAEYASAIKENRFNSIATQALSALTLGLFLILAITIRGLGLRLYLAFPAILVGSFLAATRIQLLIENSSWRPMQMAGIAFIIAQIAAALHYLPVSALGYGLMLLGLLYALSHFFAAIHVGQEPRQAAREPIIVLAIFWLLGIVFR